MKEGDRVRTDTVREREAGRPASPGLPIRYFVPAVVPTPAIIWLSANV